MGDFQRAFWVLGQCAGALLGPKWWGERSQTLLRTPLISLVTFFKQTMTSPVPLPSIAPRCIRLERQNNPKTISSVVYLPVADPLYLLR
jgi:hypothetical protein